ncbi:unnamed protein product [Amoebophrya sp. A25]|nr:unnamed protein product [Amoebophrya sp. A25]|eukprot:GSA25T00000451001.1
MASVLFVGGAGDNAQFLSPPSGLAAGTKQKSLAHRFCKFMLQLINRDLDYLFEEFLPVFANQNEHELASGQGETLEQYACFQKYVAIIEKKLEIFALNEGYVTTIDGRPVHGEGGDVERLLLDLQQAMEVDRKQTEVDFEQFLSDYRSQVLMEFGYANTDCGDVPDCSSNELDKEVQQMRMLFKPTSVEDLFNAVLNMTEYAFFSNLMRERVRQKRMEERASMALKKIEQRRKNMLEGEFGLAFRFIEFAVELLQDKMDVHYAKWIPLFDPDSLGGSGALNGGPTMHGESSHAQFSAFKEYERLIETEMRVFLVREGFAEDDAGAAALLAALEALVEQDSKEVLNQRLLQEQKQYERGARKRERQARGTDGNSSSDGEQERTPWRQFHQLRELIAQVLESTEFSAFADLMLAKVQEDKLLNMLFGDGISLSEDMTTSPPMSGGQGGGEAASTLTNTIDSTPASMALLVPEGCGGGSTVNFATPDGQNLSTVVPDGLVPGQAFEVSYTPVSVDGQLPPEVGGSADGHEQVGLGGTSGPTMKELAVQVPEGCAGGSEVFVTTPEGQQIQVIVPEGLSQRMTFNVTYYS